MLNKTNEFRALMRLLRPAYLHVASSIGEVPKTAAFAKLFDRVKLKDDDFDVESFKPGSSGEALLYQTLLDQSGLARK